MIPSFQPPTSPVGLPVISNPNQFSSISLAKKLLGPERKVTISEIEQMIEKGALLYMLMGQSGVGKTTLLKILRSHNNCPTVGRVLTRQPRLDDDESDSFVTRTQFQGIVAERQALISYKKYGDHYLFIKSEIARRALEGGSMVLGDSAKLPLVALAIKLSFPFCSLSPIRIEVPIPVLENRLTSERSGAYAEEGQQRVLHNRRSNFPSALFKNNQRFWGAQNFLNLTTEEIREWGYPASQIKPVTSDLIQQETDATRLANRLGLEDYFKCITQIYGIQSLEGKGVSEELKKTLQILSTLATTKDGAMIVLGGVAVRSYFNQKHILSTKAFNGRLEISQNIILTCGKLPSTDRIVSNDIDCFYIQRLEEQGIMLSTAEFINAAVKQITGNPVDSANIALRRFAEKAIFHSMKASAEVRVDGKSMEIDGIETSRIQPVGSSFEFTFEPAIDWLPHCRRVDLEADTGCFLIPPEILIMMKLLAGRGADINKKDISDAMGLILTQPINISLISAAILHQKYTAEFDRQDLPTLAKLDNIEDAGKLLKLLSILKIEDTGLTALIVEKWGLRSGTFLQENLATYTPFPFGSQNNTEYAWLDFLKQMSMMDHVLRSLSRAIAQADLGLSSSLDEDSRDILREKVLAIRAGLFSLAGFVIGREDIMLHF